MSQVEIPAKTVVCKPCVPRRLGVAVALVCAAARCGPKPPSERADRVPTVVTIGSAAAPVPPTPTPTHGKSKYRDLPGPSALAELPRGAAVYAALHLDVVTRIPEDVWRELFSSIAPSGAELGRSLHVDPERAVVGAIASPAQADVAGVIDAVVKGVGGKQLDRLIADRDEHPWLYRVIVPLESGAEPAAAARALSAVLEPDATPSTCDAPNACAEFTSIRPFELVKMPTRMLAVYVSPGLLRVDIAKSLFDTPAGPKLVAALARFGTERGGPEAPRCAAFDASGGASLCIDADQAAVGGVVEGYAKTVGALGRDDVRPDIARRIAEQGRKEADQNLVLAHPARRLLDDGTATFDFDASRCEALTSWALMPASRPSVERAFSSEVCAQENDVVARLLPRVLDAFGAPGPDFENADSALRSVQDAGWGAWPVLFARTWPNVLMVSRDKLFLPEPESIQQFEMCVVARSGRLESRSAFEIPRANIR